MLKIILICAGFLALGAVMWVGVFIVDIGQRSPSQAAETQPEKVAYMTVSAERLIDEYKANEIAADQIYKGKAIQVTGRVDHIGKDIVDSMYITLKSADKLGFVTAQCFFDDDWAVRLSHLREGDSVTVRGTCDGKFGNVLIKNCKFPSD